MELLEMFKKVLLDITEEVIEEKVIRVRHMKSRDKKKAKLFRIKNRAKLKAKRKKLKNKLKHKKKKAGFSYGADGKIHKVVRRVGLRKRH